MRAERSRASRIRSPNSPNELMEKEIRQKARECRAFFFFPAYCSTRSGVRISGIRTFTYPMQEGGRNRPPQRNCCRLLIGQGFAIASATALQRSSPLQGYPAPMNKKKRACVATYRHSGDQLFENWLRPRPNVNDL